MPSLPDARRLSTFADRLGAFGSLLCALHCAALPFALALLPGLGVGLFGSPAFEACFTVFASLLGVSSLVVGWRRHGRLDAWRLLIPGLTLLWAGVVVAPIHDDTIHHALSMGVGGGLIAAAHWRNLRLSKRRPLAIACVACQSH